MKKIFLIIVIFFIISISITFSYRNQLILSIANRLIKDRLPQDTVTIGSVDFNPLASLNFKDIKIENKTGNYSVTIKDVFIVYTLPALIKKQIDNINISGASAKFGKLRISGVEFKSAFLGGILNIKEFYAEALGGNISGRGEINLSEQEPVFKMDISVRGLDLEKLCADFDLKKKIELTGLCDLTLRLNGIGRKFTDVSGYASTKEGGGKFIIKDRSTLEKMPVADEQTMNLMLESLKDYYYDKGNADVSLEGGNLILKIAMAGLRGKRDLAIVFHNFHL